MVIGFLLGFIVVSSLAASIFFLKFWRETKDPLFLAFSLAFAIEALNRTRFLFEDKPNEGSPSIYLVRLIAFVIILSAILWKNRRRN
jgi:hypothetical protein